MLFVRNWLGAFASRDKQRDLTRPPARHWWASFKPWANSGLGDNPPITKRQYARLLAVNGRRSSSWDPTEMARLYEYVVRMEEPGPHTAALEGSHCFRSQRAFRGAIEGWAHFWEVFDMWEKWNGSPVGWVRLPY